MRQGPWARRCRSLHQLCRASVLRQSPTSGAEKEISRYRDRGGRRHQHCLRRLSSQRITMSNTLACDGGSAPWRMGPRCGGLSVVAIAIGRSCRPAHYVGNTCIRYWHSGRCPSSHMLDPRVNVGLSNTQRCFDHTICIFSFAAHTNTSPSQRLSCTIRRA